MAFPGAVPAGVGKRVLAAVIDSLAAVLLGGAFLAAGLWQVVAAARDDGGDTGAGVGLALVGGAALLVLGLVQWWYHGRRGATLGKALVGLRTVDADAGHPVGLGRALLRGLVVAAGVPVLGVGHLVVLASPLFDATGRRQGWHDKAARALVVDVVVGADPARARAAASAATARLDGLLGPVAAVDLPAGPPPPPPPPPPDGAGDGPGVDPLAPFPAAVPPEDPAAEVPPPAPPTSEVPPGPQPWPPPGSADPHAPAPAGDGPGIISAVPGSRPPSVAGRPTLEPTILVDHVPAGLAASAWPPPEADPDDDVDATRLSLVRPAGGRRRSDGAPPRAVLRLWDGTELTLTGLALVGRNPVRRDDDAMPEHVVTVPDERRSVSKTHLAVGVDPLGTWVRDRGSTNGTVVTLPDGAQVICAPGQEVRVPVGATVSFGDYWFTVA